MTKTTPEDNLGSMDPQDHPVTSPATRPPSTMILRTLDKGLRVLDLLATDAPAEGLTLTEIAARLGMHRTTVFRLLATLRQRGYIVRDAKSDRYTLGTHIVSLASSLLRRLDAREVARPVLLDLRDRTDELVHLAVRDGDDIVTVERIEGTQALSLQTGIGVRRPVYCTAAGKAILASLPTADRQRLLALDMPRLTANTITDSTVMQQQLVAIRAKGYAVDDEERIEGVRCVAAPVFNADGEVCAAVSLAAPAVRMTSPRLVTLGEEVRSAAETISRQLAYSGNFPGKDADQSPPAALPPPETLATDDESAAAAAQTTGAGP